MTAGNQLTHPGALTVLGTPVDISRIDCGADTYVVAGRTDHITPWKSCYRTTQMVSGRTQFVLVSAATSRPWSPTRSTTASGTTSTRRLRPRRRTG